jgi:GNAT superfamily N-acetyltransferase
MICKFRVADLTNENDSINLIRLLNEFSLSNENHELDVKIQNTLVNNLIQTNIAVVYFAYIDGEIIGIAICFYGFSTFKNKKLINIHDLYIMKQFQNRGIGSKFLQYIENENKEICCKVTLEVYKTNINALKTYEKNNYIGSSDKNYVIFSMYKNI